MTTNKTSAGKLIAVGASSLLLLLALPGCSDGSAGQGTSKIDFNYAATEKSDDTGLTIALVEPSMTNPDTVPPPPADDAPTFAKQADGYTVQAQMQIQLMKPDKTAKQFRSMFEHDYQPQLRAAVNDTIAGILKDKGFTVAPADHYNDPVDEGGPAFLASVPNLTLGFGNKTQSKNCANNVCTQKGKLLIDGQYLYQMAEPVTGTSVAYRRMNLYGLRIEEPYTYQTYKQDPGIIARVKHLFGVGQNLKDTREQALITGLNRLYKQTMSETDRTISRPQLLALRETLKQLKASGPMKKRPTVGGAGG